MMFFRKSESISLFTMSVLYVLSIVLSYVNLSLHLNSIDYYKFNLFPIYPYWAKVINVLFLVVNVFFISKIFTNKDRDIAGEIVGFVYLLMHNKIWFDNHLNPYLISDFSILISLYFIVPKDTKQRINIVVFYLSLVFGIFFLFGLNLVYAFIIPMFLFILFLKFDWKSWIIFLLGFLLPVYFYVTVYLLLNKNPWLYLGILVNYSIGKMFQIQDILMVFQQSLTNIAILFVLIVLFVSGLKEWSDVSFYSSKDRRVALFFFFLMFFSLFNYFYIYITYHQYSYSVIALPYSYYVGRYLNKISGKLRYFLMIVILILVSFL